jgi:hypothetical protein
MRGVSLDSEQAKPSGFAIRSFSKSLRICWLVIFAITVVSEVYPFPLLPPGTFYSIWTVKLLLFLILGYMGPLAFWRFNALNRGIVLAAGSAALVEFLQGALGHGHAFHWYELLVKLALILAGFIVGLGAMHDRQIVIGPLHIALL